MFQIFLTWTCNCIAYESLTIQLKAVASVAPRPNIRKSIYFNKTIKQTQNVDNAVLFK